MDSNIVNKAYNEMHGDVEYKEFRKFYSIRQPGDYLKDGEIVYLVAKDRSIRRVDKLFSNVSLPNN
jgi:hypothetical protein